MSEGERGKAKIAIVGVGAMGCLWAAHLSPLADVVLVGNWPEQLLALQNRGLTLIHADGRHTRHSIHVTNNVHEVEPVNLVLILVKSSQTERAARQAGHILTSDGLALTLQNGVGNLETLTSVVGEGRVAAGVTTQGATMMEPGIVRHAGNGPTYLGRPPASAVRLESVARLFCRAGLETHLVDDISGLIWGKLAVSAAINPLTALLRVPNGYLVENQTAQAIMKSAAQETAALAAAQGIQLPFPDAAEQALIVAQATAANYSSMLQDVLRGAPTEIEAISGAIVRLGRRFNVPTPINEKLFQLVKQVDSQQLTVNSQQLTVNSLFETLNLKP